MRSVRPIRVLAHNSLYPLSSETYIGDELRALQREGVQVAMSRERPTKHLPRRRPSADLYDDFEDALIKHDPDVVLFHWTVNAIAHRDALVARGIPYAVRTHSFDQPAIGDVLADPDCVGVWQFGHESTKGDLTRWLPTLIDGAHPLGPQHREPSLLLATATLPKRGLVDMVAPSLADLPPNVSCTIALGGTEEFEHIVDAVVAAAAGAPGITVRTEVDYDEVQSIARSTAVVAYSVVADVPVGQPRSVLEGALAGCDLVLPDLPSIRSLVDDLGHFYTPGDRPSFQHALFSALEQPIAWNDRAALAERVWKRHSVEHQSLDWTESLIASLVEWRRHHPVTEAEHISRWWRYGY